MILDKVHAYILHARPYRDTSLMLDCLSRDYGRIAVSARNARGNTSRFRGACQPFSSLIMDLRGTKPPYSLMQLDLGDSPIKLTGDALLCGFYVNELMSKLIKSEEDSHVLFSLYEKTLYELYSNKKLAIVLRIFEKNLLAALGYDLCWTHTADDNAEIVASKHYNFHLQQGFTEASRLDSYAYPGSSILAMDREEIAAADVQPLKQIMRQRINFYLGGLPVNSRQMF